MTTIIRHYSDIDDKKQLAMCIYQTDPYIYPTAFGEDEQKAIEKIETLVGESL